MNILQNKLKRIAILYIIFQVLVFIPVFALDLDSTVNDTQRQNYTKTEQKTTVNQTKSEGTVKTKDTTPVAHPVEEKVNEAVKPAVEVSPKPSLPNVPALPKQAGSSTVSPINTEYSGKVPNENAIIPCNNIKVDALIIDESVVKSKTAEKKVKSTTSSSKTKTASKTTSFRSFVLAKGTQVRVISQSKITDYCTVGQKIVFLSTQEIRTPYYTIPKNTKYIARVEDVHGPQISCNGGLVALKIVSADICGRTQPINAGIIKLKTDNIHFSNLKGAHTYWKTTCKKAKWGQNIYSKWAKTSTKLASGGPAVILAPFPYLGGCVLAAASTVSSPVTALFGKGGHLTIPAKTVFTIKVYEDTRIRY